MARLSAGKTLVELLDMLVWLLGQLPMPLLWLWAKVVYFLVYHVLRYRRKVVDTNLALAFPHATVVWRTAVARRYYHNLAEWLVLLPKLRSRSPEWLARRVSIRRRELFETYKDQTVVLVLGHQFHWEWGGARMAHWSPLEQALAFYLPQKNRHIDTWLAALRRRHGLGLLAANQPRAIRTAYQAGHTLLIFLADQHPANDKTCAQVQFLGRELVFGGGWARIALAADSPVIYVGIRRLGFGRYEGIPQLLYARASDAGGLRPLVQAFASALETSITAQPHNWLWSHRRWKSLSSVYGS